MNKAIGEMKVSGLTVRYMMGAGEYWANVRNAQGEIIADGYWRTDCLETLKRIIEVNYSEVA